MPTITFEEFSQGHPVQGRSFQSDQEDGRDLLDKTTDIVNKIFPGKQVGEAIGTLAGYGVSKLQGTDGQYDLSAPSPVQVAGDVAAGAASIAGFKGVGSTGGVLRKAIESAGIGAGISGGKSVAEGDGIGEVIQDTAIGAGTGAAVSGAFSSAEQILKGFRALPERLVRSATGQSKKQIMAGQDVSKYVIENRKVGTAEKLIRDSQSAIDKASSIIKENLKGSSEKVLIDDVFDSLAKSDEAINAEYTIDNLKDIIQQVAPQSKRLINKGTLTLEEANDLRQLLDKTIGDRGFLMSQQTLNKEFLKNFSGALRERVKSQAPEGTRPAFNTLSNEIRLRNSLTEKMTAGSRNKILSLTDLLSATGGGVVGGLPGALATIAVNRVGQSTPVLTGTAVLVNSLDEKLTPILESLAPAVQTAIITAIVEAVSEIVGEEA